MDVFGALADPVRRSLLLELAQRPCRVADLALARPISRPAVSRHLRVLSESRLVTVQVRGREHFYRLEPTGLGQVRQLLDDLTPAGGGPGRQSGLAPHLLDALDLEVRRTVRERAGTRPAASRDVGPAGDHPRGPGTRGRPAADGETMPGCDAGNEGVGA
ncbi:MAG: ArsR/SmtB family transcription factor [Actinomycetales bacterium]